jgi:hypothetical protein
MTASGTAYVMHYMRARKMDYDYGMQVFKSEETMYCQTTTISNYIYISGGKKTN